ncbi:MAG: hypothetical protein JJW01_02470 [Alphaproteobacteria bacterium]|nr:hypothetical protein [Rickettsiales bacterium]
MLQVATYCIKIALDSFKMYSSLPLSGGTIAVSSLYGAESKFWWVCVFCFFIGINTAFIFNYFFGQLGFFNLYKLLNEEQKERMKKDENKITISIILLCGIFVVFNNTFIAYAITLGGLLNVKKKAMLSATVFFSIIAILHNALTIVKP